MKWSKNDILEITFGTIFILLFFGLVFWIGSESLKSSDELQKHQLKFCNYLGYKNISFTNPQYTGENRWCYNNYENKTKFNDAEFDLWRKLKYGK